MEQRSTTPSLLKYMYMYILNEICQPYQGNLEIMFEEEE